MANYNKILRYLFDTEKLAIKLPEAAAQEDGITFRSTFGSVQVKAKAATATGENFMSDAYIVSAVLNGSDVEHRAFVKVLPSAPMLYQGAISQGVYPREIAAYEVLHPMLRELRDKARVKPDRIPLAVPAIYHSLIDEQGQVRANATAVVMEDLSCHGYRMSDKKIGANFDEVMITLEALANYHALSVALVRQWRNEDGQIVTPESLKFVENPLAFQDMICDMMAATMPMYIDMLRHYGRGEIADWVDNDFKTEARKAITPEKIADCEPLVGVLHSDCWINNMLYRYDGETKRVAEMRIIDWQIIRLGHPTIDLIHYLYTSTTADVRKKHMSTFLNHYYDTFTDALTSVRCPIIEESNYSRRRFLRDIQQRIRYGLYYSFMVLPAMHDTSFADAVDVDKKREIAEGEELPEMFDIEKIKDFSSLDKIIGNKPLCDRLIATVEEVKAFIERKDHF